ncbi:hypothetical protein BT93_F2176 [Corymbia citriodora subsp. variegata]|nr:hypothetical protein BT93_F2176 [Corymbia citriodora subsp. variegata]
MAENEVIPALVKHLQGPPLGEGDKCGEFCQHEVEKASAHALRLFAMKPEHQQLVVDSGALTHLLNLLKRHKAGSSSQSVNGLILGAAEAISRILLRNSSASILVRMEGGIPLLVELLDANDVNVQVAAVMALIPMAWENKENGNQIVDSGALPRIVLILQSDNADIQVKAVALIKFLVCKNSNIVKDVLAAGGLQPIIGLLSSSCVWSQMAAAYLVKQFAAAHSVRKDIVQMGAVRPLIEMLRSPKVEARILSASALRRLAQDSDTQVGIIHDDGLPALLGLLDSESELLMDVAVCALHTLLNNEENVSDFITIGGFWKLHRGEFTGRAKESCARTLESLKKKIHGQVLEGLVYLMKVLEKAIQERIAFALAHLCSPLDHQMIFLDNSGLELLLGLLTSTCPQQQLDGGEALFMLASNPMCPLPPTQVNLRKQYKKKPMPYDVTFWVEGQQFYAHKFLLSASSDAFHAMFYGNYQEKDATEVEIPDIRQEVFAAMMRFIYTGSVDITMDIAQDLLKASDQYLMEELKRLCQGAIAEGLSLENVANILKFSEDAYATSLKKSCILFILKHFAEFRQRYSDLIQGIVPTIREYFLEMLTSI